MSTISAIKQHLTVITLFSIAVVSFVSLPADVRGEVTPHITEFPIPTASSVPTGITTGPDGNIWFTETVARKIGRITPTGVIAEFVVPTSSFQPSAVTAGPDGNLWFVQSNNKIGRITPEGGFAEYTIPTANSEPGGITAGPDGNIWFTEKSIFANKIGKITPAGDITEYPVPTGSSIPGDITAGPDGNLWFTEVDRNQIGKITPNGEITEYPIPPFEGNNPYPEAITAGPDGNLWFTETEAFAIGKITPNGELTVYPLPTLSRPTAITAGPDGNVWYMQLAANKIGRITPEGIITEFSVPTPSSQPYDITAGPDGNVWFTEVNGNKIGRIEIAMSTPSGKTPALFIPGLMGTEMEKGSDVLWADVNKMLASFGDSFMDPLAFTPSGLPSDIAATTTSVISTVETPFHKKDLDYTTSLVSEFVSRGYSTSTNSTSSVFALFPYDWRKDIGSIADNELRAKIDTLLTQTGAEKVDIIAHSQGGLVIKKLLLDHPEYKSKIRKLIFLGTPQLGAPKAAKVLLYGDDFDVTYKIWGLDPAETKYISQNMPSAYQLLPSEQYFNTVGGYLSSGGTLLNTPNQTTQKLKTLGLNSTLLDTNTASFHNTLDLYDFTGSGIDVTNIVGCNQPSVAQIKLGTNHDSSLLYTKGDGTVPIASAEAVFGATRTLFATAPTVEHAAMPSLNGVRQTIADILTGTSTPRADISESPVSCDLSGRVFSVHSPVDLNIYDSQGNHLGPTDDGGFEANIPGSSYDTLGDEKFAFVPEGNYTVKLNATDAGHFSFFSSQVEDNETISTASYLDIPIASTSKAEVITNDQNTQSIALDATGQGTATTTVTPTAVITGSSTDDITPPITTLVATGTKGTNNYFTSQVTVTFSATDTATGTPSGLLKTEYAFDNSTSTIWQTYSTSTPLVATTTTTFYYYSTDRLGNKEAVASTTIMIDTVKPSTPLSLTTTPMSTSTIRLSWATSTDNIGIAEYKIFRATSSSATMTLIGTSTASTTSYVNTGLTASTTYWYQIKAVDVAGLVSSSSSKVSTTTQKLPTTIFQDTFESALNWTKVGAVTWYTGTPKVGTHAVRLQTTANIDKAISLANYGNVTITFKMGANSLDTSSENVKALYYNGTSWVTLATIANNSANENNQLNPYTFTLPASMNGKTTFKLRFKINGSDTTDYGFVDEVKLVGTPK